ncbi:riboflavin synthase [Fictibacillus enclensis]|uniref:riboflavin synthase n=1 Tax=Fictibacillus enclensis TaxID=1017270 RepID=UPI0024C014D7|nr:riboflavin synthase [Fictibacillus enclensis]MDM5197657.1 riboflavin synthase [Fictibacillus enclensis]MDM5336812.1 riboflavin synthase [Fictibacillus enclensis]WHY73240.1 riboflavin synthase [Fictibacillus enclensis]
MFTGIVEELGTIEGIKKGNETIVLTISASKILEDVQLGDSISVNGVCLTVTTFSEKSFTVDIMPETYRSTGLKLLSFGSKVNLERAMSSGGRFGGHFVSGHIDGTGEIVQKRPEKNAIYYDIKVPKRLLNYLLLKGSVAVDGTSLTIFGLTDDTFTVSLIPHTVSHTVLGDKAKGDSVNVECDMLGKYVEKFITGKKEEKQKSAITLEYLAEHGF